MCGICSQLQRALSLGVHEACTVGSACPAAALRTQGPVHAKPLGPVQFFESRQGLTAQHSTDTVGHVGGVWLSVRDEASGTLGA